MSAVRVVESGTPGAQPLMSVAIANAGGLRKGAKAVEVLVSWGWALQSAGHELGASEGGHISAAVREYAAYWRLSERTAWRDLDAFKRGFPGEESPAAIAAQIVALVEAKSAARMQAAAAGLLVAA